MILIHLISVTAALVIDHFIGDPPSWPHPVRWFGSLIAALEKRLNQGSNAKIKGVIMLFAVVLIPTILTFLILYASYQLHTFLGLLLESLIIATTISKNGLAQAAKSVYEPLNSGNLAKAREETGQIVGRDTEELKEQELTRATVETVAENISDGVTAPLFWAIVGGAPLAILHRVVNTCDSMVGYQNDRYASFGWSSARFDDVLNWIPARITGYVMMFVSSPYHQSKRQALKTLPQEARKHSSPNSGWGEAAAAILLGVQLGGKNTYQGVPSESPRMGQALRELNHQHILVMATVMKRTALLFLLLLWGVGGCASAIIAWF